MDLRLGRQCHFALLGHWQHCASGRASHAGNPADRPCGAGMSLTMCSLIFQTRSFARLDRPSACKPVHTHGSRHSLPMRVALSGLWFVDSGIKHVQWCQAVSCHRFPTFTTVSKCPVGSAVPCLASGFQHSVPTATVRNARFGIDIKCHLGFLPQICNSHYR